jgi:hypothetical protein
MSMSTEVDRRIPTNLELYDLINEIKKAQAHSEPSPRTLAMFEALTEKIDKVSGIWWKVSLAMIIPFASAVFGYGILTSNVSHLEEQMSEKANKETVENQLNSISLSLDNINRKLDSLTIIKTK